MGICPLHRFVGGDQVARKYASHTAIGAGPDVTDILAVAQNALRKLFDPNAVQRILAQHKQTSRKPKEQELAGPLGGPGRELCRGDWADWVNCNTKNPNILVWTAAAG